MGNDKLPRLMTPEEKALYLAERAVTELPKGALKLGVTLISIPIDIVIDGVKASVAVEYKPKKK